MVKDTYSARLAYFYYTIEAGERGFFITLSGFNDKLPLLLQTILSHFEEFEKNLDEVHFLAVCDQVKKDYYNLLIDPEILAQHIKDFMMKDVYR